MENVFSLGDIIRDDYAERVTGRTQRALSDIGVTSTFVKISPRQIKKLRCSTDLDPVKFLLEIYRIVTGKYFTEEEYSMCYFNLSIKVVLTKVFAKFQNNFPNSTESFSTLNSGGFH